MFSISAAARICAIEWTQHKAVAASAAQIRPDPSLLPDPSKIPAD